MTNRYFSNSMAALLLLAAMSAAGCAAPDGLATHSLNAPFETKPWSGDDANGRQLDTRHYRIFTTSQSQRLIAILPGFMEACYANYLSVTHLPDSTAGQPMSIYLFGSRQEWANLTRSITGENAELYLSIANGGYCYDKVCVFWDMGGLGTLSIASHEGLHQFLANRMKDHLPMWVEEGLCASVEAYDIYDGSVKFTPNHHVLRYADLRKIMLSDKWIPIDKLLPMDAGDVVQKFSYEAVGYYGQLWALVLFLRSRPDYSAGLDNMLADAQAGRFYQALNLPPEAVQSLQRHGRIYNRTLSEKLFRHYITDDLPTFDRQFRAFAAKLVNLR